jgi:hypothetical protein
MGIDTSLIWAVIIVFGVMMYVVMDGFDLGIGFLFFIVRDRLSVRGGHVARDLRGERKEKGATAIEASGMAGRHLASKRTVARRGGRNHSSGHGCDRNEDTLSVAERGFWRWRPSCIDLSPPGRLKREHGRRRRKAYRSLDTIRYTGLLMCYKKRRAAMKRLDVVKVLGSVVVMAAMSPVHSQTSEPAADMSGQAASMPMASSQQAMPSKASDRQLAKKVRHALAHSKGLNMSHLVVLVKGGHVALTGTVSSSDQIRRAAQVAGGVPGVRGVRNDLTVKMKGN